MRRPLGGVVDSVGVVGRVDGVLRLPSLKLRWRLPPRTRRWLSSPASWALAEGVSKAVERRRISVDGAGRSAAVSLAALFVTVAAWIAEEALVKRSPNSSLFFVRDATFVDPFSATSSSSAASLLASWSVRPLLKFDLLLAALERDFLRFLRPLLLLLLLWEEEEAEEEEVEEHSARDEETAATRSEGDGWKFGE